MSRRRPSNRRSLDAALRRLRAEDRLDSGLGEVVATAAQVLASEVDDATAVGSDVSSHSRARIISPYLSAVKLLGEYVRPDDSNAWTEFERSLAQTLADEEARAARASSARLPLVEDRGNG